MTNHELMRSWLEEADDRLGEAQEALEQARFVLETVKTLIEAAGGRTGRPEG